MQNAGLTEKSGILLKWIKKFSLFERLKLKKKMPLKDSYFLRDVDI